jgi:hypothetical protein
MTTTMQLPEPRYRVTDDNHKYTIEMPNGERIGPLLSVTKVLEVLNKPALVPWAARESAGFFKSEILRLGRAALDAATLEQIAKDAAGAHRRKAKDAADLGSACHDAFEAIILGREPESLPKELEGPVAAFKRYRLQSDTIVVATELAVASAEHKAGGRLDWIGYSQSRGGWGIGDYKTSSGFYGNEYAYQAGGGYALMVEEMFGVEIKWAEISRFSKKPPYESEARAVTSIDDAKQGFLTALTMTRFNAMQLIGEPLFSSLGEQTSTSPAPKKAKAAKASPVGF